MEKIKILAKSRKDVPEVRKTKSSWYAVILAWTLRPSTKPFSWKIIEDDTVSRVSTASVIGGCLLIPPWLGEGDYVGGRYCLKKRPLLFPQLVLTLGRSSYRFRFPKIRSTSLVLLFTEQLGWPFHHCPQLRSWRLPPYSARALIAGAARRFLVDQERRQGNRWDVSFIFSTKDVFRPSRFCSWRQNTKPCSFNWRQLQRGPLDGLHLSGVNPLVLNIIRYRKHSRHPWSPATDTPSSSLTMTLMRRRSKIKGNSSILWKVWSRSRTISCFLASFWVRLIIARSHQIFSPVWK